MHLDVKVVSDLHFLDIERNCTQCILKLRPRLVRRPKAAYWAIAGRYTAEHNIIGVVTELLHDLLNAIRDLDPVLRTLVAGIVMLLETSVFIGLIVPGDSIALIAAIGVETGAQFFWLVVALLLGAVAGESIGFWLGRLIGPKLRYSRVGRKLGERNWRVAERYLGRRGGLAVFLSRFLPVLHAVVPLTAGMAGMSYRRFLTWTSSASILWAFLIVSFGAGAAGTFEQLAERTQAAGFILIALVLALAVTLWLVKRWLFRTELASTGAAHTEPIDTIHAENQRDLNK